MFLICSDGERGMVLSVPQGSSQAHIVQPTSVLAEVSVACSVVDEKYGQYPWLVFGSGLVHVESQPVPPFDEFYATNVRDETTKRAGRMRGLISGLRIGGRDICKPPETVFVQRLWLPRGASGEVLLR